MTDAIYDSIEHYYSAFVHRELQKPDSHFTLRTNELLRILGTLDGMQICDLACGEGYLSRLMAKRGARVTAVDISGSLLVQAKKLSGNLNITYLLDDAQTLSNVTDSAFDLVVCNMALMDMPTILPVFQTAYRTLKPNGRFIVALLHPCFESPFTVPEAAAEVDEAGNFIACRVLHYTQEGHWQSGGQGIRSKVGAYHRKLSTYLNGLIQAGFIIEEVTEPTLPASVAATTFETHWIQKIPRTLLISNTKPC